MHDRVAGLDVHKDKIVACVRVVDGRKATRACRTFGTATPDLEALLAWLKEAGCSHVAMEAAGVYWKPVWNLLGDGDFELILASAAHIKTVPGRKTDMNDAMWIADLAACGLVRASFVPEEDIQELRARKQLIREQVRHVQRVQKTLEAANIKLDSGQATFRSLICLLCTMPGVSHLAAAAILAEIGRDMSCFPTAGHLVAWAGFCPGQNESAGKRKSSRLRKGALVEAHDGAMRLGGQTQEGQRLPGAVQPAAEQAGPKTAICAVAASMLTAIYHMLKDGAVHQDLGAAYFDRRSAGTKAKRLVAQLTKLGYQVDLQPVAKAA